MNSEQRVPPETVLVAPGWLRLASPEMIYTLRRDELAFKTERLMVISLLFVPFQIFSWEQNTGS